MSSDKINDVTSILYAKEYIVIPIRGYYNEQYEDSAIALLKSGDNDELRRDALHLLKYFNEDCAIIKYNGEPISKKIFRDGSEKPLSMILYNTDSNNRSYLYNGVSFSFVESKRYWKPLKKEDIKRGMIVEYLNNNKWYSKTVQDPISEWNDMYNLLVKYDKLRVEHRN